MTKKTKALNQIYQLSFETIYFFVNSINMPNK